MPILLLLLLSMSVYDWILESSGASFSPTFSSALQLTSALLRRRWTTLKIGSTLAEVTKPPEDPTVKFSRQLPDGLEDQAEGSRSGLPGGY